MKPQNTPEEQTLEIWGLNKIASLDKQIFQAFSLQKTNSIICRDKRSVYTYNDQFIIGNQLHFNYEIMNIAIEGNLLFVILKHNPYYLRVFHTNDLTLVEKMRVSLNSSSSVNLKITSIEDHYFILIRNILLIYHPNKSIISLDLKEIREPELVATSKHIYVLGKLREVIFPQNIYKLNNSINIDDQQILIERLNDQISCVTKSGKILLLDRFTFDITFETMVSQQILCIASNRVSTYLGTRSGKLLIHNPTSNELSDHSITENAITAVFADDDVIIVGTNKGELLIVSIENYTIIGEISFSGQITSIFVDEYFIYVATTKGRTIVLDNRSYHQMGKMDQRKEILAVTSSKVEIYTGGVNGHIIAWDKTNFQKLKSASVGSWVTGLVLDSLYLYVSTANGFVHIFTLKLEKISSIFVHNGLIYDITLTMDKIIVSTEDGEIKSISKIPVEPTKGELSFEIKKGVAIESRYYFLDDNALQVKDYENPDQESEVIDKFQFDRSDFIKKSDTYIYFNIDKRFGIFNSTNKKKFISPIRRSYNIIIAGDFILQRMKDGTDVYKLSDLDL